MAIKKIVAFVAATVMLLSVMPLSAFAASVEYDQTHGGCDYYNLITKNDYALAPGAVESEIVINNDEGTARNVVHVIEVDLTNPNISVMPANKNISETVDYSNPANWGIQGMTEHAAYVEEELGLNVVGGMNVSLSWSFSHPYGLLIYNGIVLCDNRAACDECGSGHPGGGYLAITKDGKAELRGALDPLTGDEWMAQTVCFSYIVKDGVSMHTTENHADDANAAPRSVIGIKADGTLVLMMVDGRQAPYSKGMQNHEMAEMMLELGCVDAINCDGGGSSTFLTEREGTGELTMKSSPSDGSERSTISGILVISKAVADGKFDHAAVESEEDYVTPGSIVKFNATGADSAGGPAEIPADVIWQLADPSMGTVENGVFTSNGTVGTATVQMVYNGNVVGEDSVNVVVPDSLSFVQANITAPYSKSVSLDVVAKYGFNEVTLKDGDISYALSDDAMGTIQDGVFIATSDETITAGTVTAVLACDENIVALANLTLGKASEIVYDFESGADSIANITYAYKGVYTPDKYNFKDELSVVTAAEGGKVKNGNYSLKVTCEGDSITCMNWCQTRINGWNIDLTDAVSLSFWMYIPEGSHGYEWDFGNAIPVNLGQEFITGTGWQYFTVNVADIGTNVTNLDQIRIYHSDTFDEYPNYYADTVFYIDDITVNYSTAVEDFDPPVISDVLVSHDNTDTGIEMNGQEIDANIVAITAKAADSMEKTNYTGLDTSSVKVFVDGVAVSASCTDAGFITTADIELANGTHIFRIEASDNRGNTSYIEKTIVIAAEGNTKNTIDYAPVDATKVDLLADSLFWMDLTATAIDKVEKVEMVIDLDNNSDWELDNMVIADGFTATYTIDSENNDATITFTRTGTVTAIGTVVLAKLPVRVWSPTFANVNEDAHAYRLMAVESYVQMGLLTETDGTTVAFGSAKYSNVTEFNNSRLGASSVPMEGWHSHTAEALEDLAPICTENGYTDRTYCAVCASVVDWGTSIPATGHSYALVDLMLVCTECGEADTDYNGYWQDENGWAYLLEGVAMNDWINLEDGWHFFMSNGYAPVGSYEIGGLEYSFDGEKGKCIGAWKVTANGSMYYYCHRYYKNAWAQIDGATYYFNNSGYMLTGLCTVGANAWEFAEDGKFIQKINGVFYEPTHNYYAYAIDGVMQYDTGLIEWENDYYYVRNNARLITWPTYVSEEKANGLLPAGDYSFGEDGKLIMKNGIAYDDYGKLCYYVNGAQQFGTGLVRWNGDYYYVRDNGPVITWPTYVSEDKTNDLLPAGNYSFGEDGKMILRNGVALDDYGKLCYYINGAQQYDSGLVEWNGDYYFVRNNGLILTWASYIPEDKTNGLLPAGNYSFGEDGKMILRNGVALDDYGVLCYYINGAQQYDSGLIEWNGDYYFVRNNGLILTWASYIPEDKTNGLLPAGNYSFGEDGKMILRNGVALDNYGVLCYYVNGAQQFDTGLIEWEGDYYFVRSNGMILTWGQYIPEEKTNDLLPAGKYSFGEDGKLIMRNGVTYDDYGVLCYYINGVQQFDSGLIYWEGNYYFVRNNGLILTWASYIPEDKTNGLLPAGDYIFGADGKMVI